MFEFEKFKNESLKEKIFILNEIPLDNTKALKQLFKEDFEHKDHKLIQFQLQKIRNKCSLINLSDSNDKNLNLTSFYNLLKLTSLDKLENDENFCLFLEYFLSNNVTNDNLLNVLILKKLFKVLNVLNFNEDKHCKLIVKLSLMKINDTKNDYLVVKYSALIKLVNFKKELFSNDEIKLAQINENYRCFMLELKNTNKDYFSSDNDTLKLALRHEIFANYLLFILFYTDSNKKLVSLDLLSRNINKIFKAQDTLRIEFNLVSLNIVKNLADNDYLREENERETLKELLNPHKLFGCLMKSVNFDCDLLVDWLISNETQFLEYFMRYLKYFQNNYSLFNDNLNEIKKLFIKLNNKIKKSEKHFPYNCKPLLKLLDRINEISF